MKPEIVEAHDNWYWMVEGDNQTYEWSPSYPENWRIAFYWKWLTNLKPGLRLETALTINKTTGMVDEYSAEYCRPYEVKDPTWR